ncbi:MAG: AAA family ATPase [Duodenibacillus sp.]
MAITPPARLVLLIDEYDAPLTACLGRPELYDGVRSTLTEFFQTLALYGDRFRFFFMTGITRFRETDVFSSFDAICDISLDPTYGTLLGFTDEELCANFPLSLNTAGSELGLSPEELLESLKSHYGGFCFDALAQTQVLCPWSVLNFLKYPKLGFAAYWFRSGGNPLNQLKSWSDKDFGHPKDYVRARSAHLSALESPQNFSDLSWDQLLLQAGYLTIRSVIADGWFSLGYPNEEVSRSLAALYARNLVGGRRLHTAEALSVTEVLSHGEAAVVAEMFNQMVNAVDAVHSLILDAASCCASLAVLLLGTSTVSHVKYCLTLGGTELEVDAGSCRWVVAIRFATTHNEVSRLLASAAEQLRLRIAGLTSHERNLYRVVLVFEAESRRFVHCLV